MNSFRHDFFVPVRFFPAQNFAEVNCSKGELVDRARAA